MGLHVELDLSKLIFAMESCCYLLIQKNEDSSM